MKKLIVFALLLCSVQSIHAQKLIPKMSQYEFLLGEFDVKVYLPDAEGKWQPGGEGEASIVTTLGGTYVEENIATKMGNGTLTMKNTIGVDSRTRSLRLVAMDKEFSSMDVYSGSSEGTVLKFNNLKSDEAFVSANGTASFFRLTYQKESEKMNSLVVEITTDQGKTWKPFVRHEYLRR